MSECEEKTRPTIIALDWNLDPTVCGGKYQSDDSNWYCP